MSTLYENWTPEQKHAWRVATFGEESTARMEEDEKHVKDWCDALTAAALAGKMDEWLSVHGKEA